MIVGFLWLLLCTTASFDARQPHDVSCKRCAWLFQRFLSLLEENLSALDDYRLITDRSSYVIDKNDPSIVGREFRIGKEVRCLVDNREFERRSVSIESTYLARWQSFGMEKQLHNGWRFNHRSINLKPTEKFSQKRSIRGVFNCRLSYWISPVGIFNFRRINWASAKQIFPFDHSPNCTFNPLHSTKKSLFSLKVTYPWRRIEISLLFIHQRNQRLTIPVDMQIPPSI